MISRSRVTDDMMDEMEATPYMAALTVVINACPLPIEEIWDGAKIIRDQAVETDLRFGSPSDLVTVQIPRGVMFLMSAMLVRFAYEKRRKQNRG